jgi:hypothetical protein
MVGVVPNCGVEIGGFDVEADVPAPGAAGHGGEQDPAPAGGDQPPQVAGVVVHPHHPDAWQGDRPGRAVADADRWRAALRALVAQPERLHDPALAFQPWESHSATRALTLAGGGERRQGAAQVHRGFLEHLLAHLGPPAQPGAGDLGRAAAIDGDDPPGGLGLLPCVELVDEIEPGPRHQRRVGSLGRERVFDQAQAGVEREPGRPGVPSQRGVLLDRGVEAEPERRVPHEQQATTTVRQSQDCSVVARLSDVAGKTGGHVIEPPIHPT